jgi:hypothetical protein
MKNLINKLTQFLVILISIVLSSCCFFIPSEDCFEEDTVVELGIVDSLRGYWQIKGGSGLPINFKDFRLIINKISIDSASYIITPQLAVQRFDYNSHSLSGNIKFQNNNQLTTTITFHHPSNQGVTRTPNGNAQPITIKEVTSESFKMEWIMPIQDATNPGGSYDSTMGGDFQAYSYTFERVK